MTTKASQKSAVSPERVPRPEPNEAKPIMPSFAPLRGSEGMRVVACAGGGAGPGL